MKASKAHSSGNDFAWELNFVFLIFDFFLRETGREGERGEKHQCEMFQLIGCLPYAPQPATEPTTQTHALTRNRTGNLSVCGTMPSPLSPTSRGWEASFY